MAARERAAAAKQGGAAGVDGVRPGKRAPEPKPTGGPPGPGHGKEKPPPAALRTEPPPAGRAPEKRAQGAEPHQTKKNTPEPRLNGGPPAPHKDGIEKASHDAPARTALTGSAGADQSAGSVDSSGGGAEIRKFPALKSSAGTDSATRTPATSGTSDAATQRRYEASPKHGSENKGDVSRAPTEGQSALDRSVQPKETSSRRVGVDPASKEIVVFDETFPNQGVFHGHVREWSELRPEMQNALRRADLVDSRGRIKS